MKNVFQGQQLPVLGRRPITHSCTHAVPSRQEIKLEGKKMKEKEKIT